MLLWSGVVRRSVGTPLAFPFILLGAGFLFLSMDEAALVHESITAAIGERYIDWVPEVARTHKGVVLLAVAALILCIVKFLPDLRPIWNSCRSECVTALQGFTLFLAGAGVLETLGYKLLQSRAGSLLYRIQVSAEEFCEMLGISVILYAAMTFASNDLRLEKQKGSMVEPNVPAGP